MRIAVGSDHAGFLLKTAVIRYLSEAGHEVRDMGTDSTEPVDYPPYCAAVARAVVSGQADLGVVMGGSGQGEQIAANKVHGARAALCPDEYTARLARRHNDANVCALGARVVAEELALAVLDVFLTTPFEGGRHVRRIAQVAALEAEECARATGGEAAS
ncbi:MAG TPA: ribose 5-phosphate isomerase B [Acidimicrobiales bacterium]|nr:ribose 5-phosphate isomerase B [Acidimicrobiales bacterium]